MAESIVTANRLADGVVVWLDSAQVWTERLDAAAVLGGDVLQAALERVRNRDRDVAVDIRDIPVAVIEGRPAPQARRERLRSAGARSSAVRPNMNPLFQHPRQLHLGSVLRRRRAALLGRRPR